jgi:lipoprotein-releasing system ATP-binding protein
MAVRSLYVEPAEDSNEVRWGALECHDVFKIYRSGPVETVALRGLDLKVEPGELVAVLGPSGCGKSTLLALAAGLDEPSAGELRVWGRSLGRLDEAELAAYRARDLAIVFQSDNLWPALSAQENVAISLRLAGHEQAERTAAQSLAAFGLGERGSHRAAALSGGEQQRVAIAAAAARRGDRARSAREAQWRVRQHRRRGHPFRARGRPRPARDRDARRQGRSVNTAVARTVAAGTSLIGCEDVTIEYGEGDARVTALDGVDLSIGPGERLALWGRSGSGKTTLLHVLGGLLVPSRGRVIWQGEELSSLDEAARGRARALGIAYIFQGSNLLSHFTAFENVAFAREASAESADGRAGARADYEPEDLLELVGLSSKLDALPGELSGGEAQRVAIARALAQSPELLLCDEPTGHLDSDTAERVLDLIEALQREFSFALVIATHDAGVAGRAGRVVELADGRVVGSAPS